MVVRTEFSHRSLHGAARGRRRLFFATIFILLIFGADYLSGGMIRSGLRSGAASVWNATLAVRNSIVGNGYFSRHRTLAAENATLRAELSKVREHAAAYGALSQENELFRSMLHLAQSSPGVTAPIVSSYHASPYGSFMIGAGAHDGIASGDLVLSEGGFVVGRVTDVQQSVTLVTAVFSSGSNINVVIGGAAVSAEGEGGGNARVTVPRGIEIAVGDPVIAPEFGGRTVGTVGRVEQISTSAEQRVYVSLPLNLSVMRFVYVVPAHE